MQKIMDKAIRKAIKGGYKPMMWISLKEQKEATRWEVGSDYIKWVVPGKYPRFSEPVYNLIFNHDFAKALWGEEKLGLPDSSKSGGRFDAGGMRTFQSIVNKGWKRHLQEMVIAEDPLEYLKENM